MGGSERGCCVPRCREFQKMKVKYETQVLSQKVAVTMGFFAEMDTEETYEEPPIVNTMPPRLPMPPKKVPTANLLDIKDDTLKLQHGSKPPVTQKPQRPVSDTISRANELKQGLRRRNRDTNITALEEALTRRNNVMQEPIMSIPDPSSRGTSPKPRPTPAMKPKPRGPPPVHQPVQEVMQVPVISIPGPSSRGTSPKSRPTLAVISKPRAPTPEHHPVHEEIYYNDPETSSDEEWTYEPLKPFNGYDTNIYSV